MQPTETLPDNLRQQILRTIIEKDGSIIMRNEQYDCEQVILHKEEFWFDYFSPRENLTYEQRPLTLDQAWDYAIKYVPGKVEMLRKQLQS